MVPCSSVRVHNQTVKISCDLKLLVYTIHRAEKKRGLIKKLTTASVLTTMTGVVRGEVDDPRSAAVDQQHLHERAFAIDLPLERESEAIVRMAAHRANRVAAADHTEIAILKLYACINCVLAI
jgi:hypothetical protein